MKNLYIVVTIILGVIWIAVILSGGSFFAAPNIASSVSESAKIPANSAEKAAGVPAPAVKPYSTILEQLKSPFPISRYQDLLSRNIFVKPETPVTIFTPEDLKVITVNAVSLPFMYNGFIQTSNGTVIGQVNWSGKTYFVKKGERLKDYKVLDIDRKAMRLENEEGPLILEYNKPVKGKELVATLYNSKDDKTYEVRKSDELNGYKVLDIKPDNVIIYGQNKEWILNKGR